MSAHPFVDPITRQTVVLQASKDRTAMGVEHGDCDRLADVSAELDAFYCTKCQWNGRISGAWFMDMLEAEGRL